MSSQPELLIVTTIVPPLEPVPPPVPAVAEPESWPLAPWQMMTSDPALTTGLLQGGVGQVMIYDIRVEAVKEAQTNLER
jgi:hypothetical protein